MKEGTWGWTKNGNAWREMTRRWEKKQGGGGLEGAGDVSESKEGRNKRQTLWWWCSRPRTMKRSA